MEYEEFVPNSLGIRGFGLILSRGGIDAVCRRVSPVSRNGELPGRNKVLRLDLTHDSVLGDIKFLGDVAQRTYYSLWWHHDDAGQLHPCGIATLYGDLLATLRQKLQLDSLNPHANCPGRLEGCCSSSGIEITRPRVESLRKPSLPV